MCCGLQYVGGQAEDYVGDLLTGLQRTAQPGERGDDVPWHRMSCCMRGLGVRLRVSAHFEASSVFPSTRASFAYCALWRACSRFVFASKARRPSQHAKAVAPIAAAAPSTGHHAAAVAISTGGRLQRVRRSGHLRRSVHL